MHPLLDDLDKDEREALVPRRQPDFMTPMLATLTDRPVPGDGWFYERKFDGERCIVVSDGTTVRLLSRHRKRVNNTYPDLEDAFAGMHDAHFIADGEIVAFEGDVTSFSRLQERMQIHDRRRARRSTIPVFLYLFDLMYLDGYDLCALPLSTRKRLLRRLIPFKDPLRSTEHRSGDGADCYREACEQGWEGIIAKRAAGRYLHRRSTDWLKFKCIVRQEFVIGGYTDPQGSRSGFGALLIGYYEKERLVYAGKVGTGFDERMLADLHERLAAREQTASPFAGKSRQETGEHFITPDLVCEVAFTEWTPDGKLRHPRFLGLRDDKPAGEVVREGRK